VGWENALWGCCWAVGWDGVVDGGGVLVFGSGGVLVRCRDDGFAVPGGDVMRDEGFDDVMRDDGFGDVMRDGGSR